MSLGARTALPARPVIQLVAILYQTDDADIALLTTATVMVDTALLSTGTGMVETALVRYKRGRHCTAPVVVDSSHTRVYV